MIGRTAPSPERFEEARLILSNEFGGLDTHQQYLNAFSRLLKWDPLGRVAMMGTDQRDQFVSLIRSILSARPREPQSIFDVGCGDGATFELIADVLPAGSEIDLLDPNTDYLAAYARRIAQLGGLNVRRQWNTAFTPTLLRETFTAGASGSYDVILCLHSIYFFPDLGASMKALYDSLAPGGVLIVVFADESVSYTGQCYRHFVESIDPGLAAEHEALCAERLG